MPRIEDVDGDLLISRYVFAIWDSWGKSLENCDRCKKSVENKGQIHHTKYDGATLYDLQWVCRGCNYIKENLRLI